MAVSKMNNKNLAAAILSVLSSSESDSEDELVMFERVAQPKIENFIDVIHKFNDKQVRNPLTLNLCTLHS